MPKASKVTTGLIYVGNGFYADVPARDLSADEVEQYGGVDFLTKDGFYRLPEPIKEVSNGN